MPVQTTTTSSGGFIIEKIPAKSGDRVRVYVTSQGYGKHNEYVALSGPLSVRLRKQP